MMPLLRGCLLAALGTGWAGVPVASAELERRVPWATSRLVGTPDPPPPFRLERVFPQLKFREPVALVAEPGSRRLLVVERKGTIVRFVDDPQTDAERLERFLVLGDEAYALAFAPHFAETGVFFVFRNLLKEQRNTRNRISRFRTTTDAERRVVDGSEEAVIEWPARGHNGGDLAFGPDGRLYISSGDGETGVDDPDPEQTGQDLSDLRSGILRLDVDRRSQHDGVERPYAIPADNPFVGVRGARPELWAFGLRNPWRMSFDASGRLWIGDNGEESWEAIYLGQRGANYGWSVFEAGQPFNLARAAAPFPLVAPVVHHPHAEARSIIGGRVYRGSRLPALRDTYVYGDHETGKLWGLRHDGRRVTWHAELADTRRKLVAFGEGHDGELLLVTFEGELFRLATNDAAASAAFPRRLSETGLFADAAGHRLAAGVLPFSINAPVWADGATAERFLAVPGQQRITYQAERGWEFPDGAVLGQTYSRTEGAKTSEGARRLETRLLVRHAGDWSGYSYRWNDEQADATLVGKDGETLPGPPDASWRIPSRTECLVCHSLWGPRYTIGVATEQMNRLHDYGGRRANQIEVLTRLQMLDKPPTVPVDELPRLADPTDERAGLTQRARSYLHANCAHCHRYGGAGNARMRLGFELTTDALRVVDVPPEHGTFGLTDARLIAPSQPERSVLFYRLLKLGRGRMPHLGAQSLDVAGTNLLQAWIRQLPATPAAPPDSTTAHARSLEELRQPTLAVADARALATSLAATPSGAVTLALAVHGDALPTTARAAAVNVGAEHADRHVRDLFERFLPAERRSQRLGDDIRPEAILGRTGNAEQGRRLWTEAALQCRSCHRIGEQGRPLGPDLDRLAKRTSRAEIVESLLDPSRTIDPPFQAVQVRLHDGRVLAGIPVGPQPSGRLVLRDAQTNVLDLPESDIEDRRVAPKSLMPDGLLRDLTPQEAADLVEFLHVVNAARK